MLLIALSALPLATLIVIGCGGKKKEPGAPGAPGAAPGAPPPAGAAAPAAGAPAPPESGENKTALDGQSQTGATGGGTQA